VDLEVYPGEAFGLVGPDGAGKTTTIKMLVGLIKPDSGSVTIQGQGLHKNLKAIKPVLGYMSQEFTLYPTLSVAENLRFFARAYRVPDAEERERTNELLAFSRLGPFRSRYAGRLSGGMKKKLALSCALIHTPKVLFLDEPTTGVDPVSRQDFWLLLYELLAQGVAILVSTPYMDEAERCNRVALMHEGRLLTTDTPRALCKASTSKIIELRGEKAREAFFLLHQAQTSERAELYGQKLSVRVEDGQQDLKEELERIAEEKQLEMLQAPLLLEDRFVEILETKGHKKRPMPPGDLPFRQREKGKPCIEVEGLYKYFGDFAAVDGISFKVAQGEVFGFLGPNGAGKTTCFYSVMGLVKPDSGRIMLDGVDITGLPMYRRAILGLGYLPQETSIFRGLSVEGNILTVLELSEPNADARHARLDQLLDEFGLTRLRDAPAMALSGGERRRAEIARALAADPSIMLLDEPFAGIDPISIADIRDLVKDLRRRGIGVLITDHNVRETLEIVDRAYIIYDGRVLYTGSPDELVADANVRRLYLGEGFSL
jgi:LPS export ABC transporter ATP-binding protein